MNDTILNPNCSEVVWRLDFTKALTTKEQIVRTLQNKKKYGDKMSTGTDSMPNGCVGDMISLLKSAKKQGLKVKKIELDIVDNEGGGGDQYYVGQCFDIAKEHCMGKITLKEARKKEDKLWNREGDENE